MTPTSESPPSARRIRVHLRVSEGQAGILASLFVWPGPFLGTDDDLDPVFLKLRVSLKLREDRHGPCCYPRILESNCPLVEAQLCHFLQL